MGFNADIIDSLDQWRVELTTATQRLLGDTIALSDNDWRAPSLLAGWSRAHVATHLSHHGETLAAKLRELNATHAPLAWDLPLSDNELWEGARRGAVCLQESLDQSATDLMLALDQMDEAAWATTITTSPGSLPARTLVVDRLNEVIVHHVDLQLGLDFPDLEPGLVRLLLKWNVFRSAPRFSKVELTMITDEGYSTVVGTGVPVTVRGNEVSLLGWITGRKDSSSILGAEELDLAGPV